MRRPCSCRRAQEGPVSVAGTGIVVAAGVEVPTIGTAVARGIEAGALMITSVVAIETEIGTETETETETGTGTETVTELTRMEETRGRIVESSHGAVATHSDQYLVCIICVEMLQILHELYILLIFKFTGKAVIVIPSNEPQTSQSSQSS